MSHENNRMGHNGDTLRDVKKYHSLLLAIQKATQEIRELEPQQPDIHNLFRRLLPDIAEALNAEQAFIATLLNRTGQLELTSVYPHEDKRGEILGDSEILKKMIINGKPRIIETLEDHPRKLIPGLEPLQATSAVLTRVQMTDQIFIIGVCNRRDSEQSFLVADRMALDSLVEFIAGGVRIGERIGIQRIRELKHIQKISAAINAELDQNELLDMIVKHAAELFEAPATSIMLWDNSQENLIISAGEGLSEEYIREQQVSRSAVEKEFAKIDGAKYLYTENLRRTPYGQRPDLIENEDLCSALTALLQVADEFIGVLNIYSKDEPRQFTKDEIDLAVIFANQTATAIRNAQLRQSEIQSILDTSDMVRALHDPKEIFTKIAENAQHIFNTPAVGVMVADEKNPEKLIIAAGINLSKKYQAEQTYNLQTIRLRLQKNGEYAPLFLDLPDESPGDSKLESNEGFCGLLAAPLVVAGRLIGILNIYQTNEQHKPTLSHENLARILANQAVAAIEKNQAYQYINDSKQFNANVLEMVKTVVQTPDLSEGLKKIARHAVKDLKVAFCHIVLYFSFR